MNWLDILILLIIAFYGFYGLRTGLVAGLAKLVGLVAGFIAAMNFYQPLSDMLNLKFNLVPLIFKLFPSLSGAGSAASPLSSLKPTGLGESVGGLIASGILDILCFVIILIVVTKGVEIAGIFLGKIARMFLLGPVDCLGGVALGVIKGLLASGILVALIKALQVPAGILPGGQNSFFALMLQKSILAPYFLNILSLVSANFPALIK